DDAEIAADGAEISADDTEIAGANAASAVDDAEIPADDAASVIDDAASAADDAASVIDDAASAVDDAASAIDDAASAADHAAIAVDEATAAAGVGGVLAYGEDMLGRTTIALGSGTVTVRGSGIPPGHEVWVAGRPVPVDPRGNFVAEEILPTGLHTVEVAVLDEQGNGELFLRDLELARNDWFYVGMADLTLSRND